MKKLAVSFPLYYIADKNRPMPNFTVEHLTPKSLSLAIFTTVRAAGDYLEAGVGLGREIGKPNVIEIPTEERLKAILEALLEAFPLMKYVCIDYKPPSRAKQTGIILIRKLSRQLSSKGT